MKAKKEQKKPSSAVSLEESESRKGARPVEGTSAVLASVANTKVSRRTFLKGGVAAAAVVGVSAVAAKGLLGSPLQVTSTTTTSAVTTVSTATTAAALQIPLTEPALWNTIQIGVNGTATNLKVQANWTLNKVLRETLGLTGTKISCDNSSCGACTVLMDGNPVYSCHKLAVEADGHKITTIEGVGTAAKLHPVQQAFINSGAYQCGYCTPGFIMSAIALLNTTPNPTSDQVLKALSGNVCRCGSYQHIMQALTGSTSS